MSVCEVTTAAGSVCSAGVVTLTRQAVSQNDSDEVTAVLSSALFELILDLLTLLLFIGHCSSYEASRYATSPISGFFTHISTKCPEQSVLTLLGVHYTHCTGHAQLLTAAKIVIAVFFVVMISVSKSQRIARLR
jgi:uncharacterized membrane protein YjgN (DUF898 family)